MEHNAQQQPVTSVDNPNSDKEEIPAVQLRTGQHVDSPTSTRLPAATSPGRADGAARAPKSGAGAEIAEGVVDDSQGGEPSLLAAQPPFVSPVSTRRQDKGEAGDGGSHDGSAVHRRGATSNNTTDNQEDMSEDTTEKSKSQKLHQNVTDKINRGKKGKQQHVLYVQNVPKKHSAGTVMNLLFANDIILKDAEFLRLSEEALETAHESYRDQIPSYKDPQKVFDAWADRMRKKVLDLHKENVAQAVAKQKRRALWSSKVQQGQNPATGGEMGAFESDSWRARPAGLQAVAGNAETSEKSSRGAAEEKERNQAKKDVSHEHEVEHDDVPPDGPASQNDHQKAGGTTRIDIKPGTEVEASPIVLPMEERVLCDAEYLDPEVLENFVPGPWLVAAPDKDSGGTPDTAPCQVVSSSLHPIIFRVLSFFTLPLSRQNTKNLGYIFACFRTSALCKRFQELMKEKRLRWNSIKKLQIMDARMEDLEDLRDYFTQADNDENGPDYASKKYHKSNVFWFDEGLEAIQEQLARYNAAWERLTEATFCIDKKSGQLVDSFGREGLPLFHSAAHRAAATVFNKGKGKGRRGAGRGGRSKRDGPEFNPRSRWYNNNGEPPSSSSSEQTGLWPRGSGRSSILTADAEDARMNDGGGNQDSWEYRSNPNFNRSSASVKVNFNRSVMFGGKDGDGNKNAATAKKTSSNSNWGLSSSYSNHKKMENSNKGTFTAGGSASSTAPGPVASTSSSHYEQFNRFESPAAHPHAQREDREQQLYRNESPRGQDAFQFRLHGEAATNRTNHAKAGTERGPHANPRSKSKRPHLGQGLFENQGHKNSQQYNSFQKHAGGGHGEPQYLHNHGRRGHVRIYDERAVNYRDRERGGANASPPSGDHPSVIWTREQHSSYPSSINSLASDPKSKTKTPRGGTMQHDQAPPQWAAPSSRPRARTGNEDRTLRQHVLASQGRTSRRGSSPGQHEDPDQDEDPNFKGLRPPELHDGDASTPSRRHGIPRGPPLESAVSDQTALRNRNGSAFRDRDVQDVGRPKQHRAASSSYGVHPQSVESNLPRSGTTRTEDTREDWEYRTYSSNRGDFVEQDSYALYPGTGAGRASTDDHKRSRGAGRNTDGPSRWQGQSVGSGTTTSRPDYAVRGFLIGALSSAYEQTQSLQKGPPQDKNQHSALNKFAGGGYTTSAEQGASNSSGFLSGVATESGPSQLYEATQSSSKRKHPQHGGKENYTKFRPEPGRGGHPHSKSGPRGDHYDDDGQKAHWQPRREFANAQGRD
ncbi:unnamed protein product [Amoebophrya sp. A120]|nr:unnamed protein product [Amoebophrya sp. A120]|eukprot:GSA120T00017990001.1